MGCFTFSEWKQLHKCIYSFGFFIRHFTDEDAYSIHTPGDFFFSFFTSVVIIFWSRLVCVGWNSINHVKRMGHSPKINYSCMYYDFGDLLNGTLEGLFSRCDQIVIASRCNLCEVLHQSRCRRFLLNLCIFFLRSFVRIFEKK